MKFAPMVQRLGLSMVAKFPLREGAEAIPYGDINVKLAALAPINDPATAVVQFEIKYDEQGVPSVLGISARDLQALVGNAPLAMAPELSAIAAGQ